MRFRDNSALHTSASSAVALSVLSLVPLAPGARDLNAQDPDPAVAAEVRSLATNPGVVRAMERVEALDSWGMERLVELTQIPAPPFLEAQRAARYVELLREAGADSVWIDEEGNAVALRRGRQGGRTVALGGHLDTVFPEGTDVTVRIRGDTLYAPGVGDDTRGLVVVLTVLRALEEAQVETRDLSLIHI